MIAIFINYNNVYLDIMTTNSHSMEAVYSDDGTDYLYTRFHVDVTAIISPKATSYPTSGVFPGQSIQQIRQLLLAQRQPLVITDGAGNTVLRCPEVGFPCDVANGPMPRRCEITKVIGSKSWLLRWACDFAVIECPAAESAPGLISHRYTQTHSINQYHLTTRTTVGRMKFRSDVLQAAGIFAHQLFTAQQLPGIGLPDMVPGFQRESLDVTVDSDGLGITYRVRDVEKIFNKGEDGQSFGGSGIIRLEGSAGVMSISSREGIAAGNSIAQVDVRAYGNKYSNQWTMIRRCFQIIIAKMAINPNNPPIGFVTNASIRESMGEDDKWVDVSVTFIQFPVGSSSADAPGPLRLDPLYSDVFDVMDAVFGDTAGRNPAIPNASGTMGTAEVEILTASLKAACAATNNPNSGINPVVEGPAGGAYIPEIRVAPAPPDTSDRTSLYNGSLNPTTQNTPTPYTHYRGSIEYEVVTHTLMCPTTGPPPGSQSSGSGGSGGIGESSGPGSPQWSWPAAVFALSSPTGVVRIEFQAERIGQPPAIPTLKPNQDANGPNLILSMYRIQPEMPELWVDGATKIYSVNGYMEFMMDKVPQDGGSLAMGVLPWTQLTFNDQRLILSDVNAGGSMQHGIFDQA